MLTPVPVLVFQNINTICTLCTTYTLNFNNYFINDLTIIIDNDINLKTK